jgi:hypothetical protein
VYEFAHHPADEAADDFRSPKLLVLQERAVGRLNSHRGAVSDPPQLLGFRVISTGICGKAEQKQEAEER